MLLPRKREEAESALHGMNPTTLGEVLRPVFGLSREAVARISDLLIF